MNILTSFAAACEKGSFFDFPTWHKYLKHDSTFCNPKIENINDFWLILLALIDILLRLGVILAIIFVIYGAVKLIDSRAQPDKLNNARDTIMDALIGLAIALVATTAVAFIGKNFG
jgi:K+-transporting ATPase A subunit